MIKTSFLLPVSVQQVRNVHAMYVVSALANIYINGIHTI